jgi:small basic protein
MHTFLFVSNATRRHHAMILTYLYWQGDALGISKTLAKGLQVGRRQFAGHTKVVRWLINTRTQWWTHNAYTHIHFLAPSPYTTVD